MKQTTMTISKEWTPSALLSLAIIFVIFAIPSAKPQNSRGKVRRFGTPQQELNLLNPEYQGNFGNLQLCLAGCAGNHLRIGRGSAGFSPRSDAFCFPCDCDPGCDRYGTCCVHLVDDDVKDFNYTAQDLYVLQKKQRRDAIGAHLLECRLLEEYDDGYHFIISGCDAPGMMNSDRARCEKTVTEEEINVADYLYVTNPATNVTYKNRACGRCNGITETESWELSINCAHYQKVYTATNEDELLGLSLKKDSACEVNQWPPDPNYLTSCDHVWYDDLIYQCNVTGKWEEYNSAVENLCEQNTPISDRIQTKTKNKTYLFKNIHCMYCNLGKEEIGAVKLYRGFFLNPHNGFDIFKRPPFSLLLGLSQSKQKVETFYVDSEIVRGNCSDMEWASPDGECLPLSCSPGKIATEGNCITALDQIRGLGYTVRLLFTNHHIVDDQTNTSSTCVSNTTTTSNHLIFLDAIESVLKNLPLQSYSFSLSPSQEGGMVSTELESDVFEESNCNEPEYFVSACLVADKSVGRDDVEKQIVESLVGNLTISNSNLCQSNVTFRMVPFLNNTDEKCRGQNSHGPFQNCHRNVDQTTTTNRYIYGFEERIPVWDGLNYFIPLSETLNCPYVSFPPDMFKLDTQKADFLVAWNMVIEFSNAIIEISDQVDLTGTLITKDGYLRVCHDVLNRNTKARKQKITSYSSSEGTSSTISFWQSILTLICMSVSITCLAITVLTYSLFATLRSSAGWHNLFLSVTLLLAQCLLLASTYADGPSVWCTILGVSTHFTWLAMFCWSSVCCFHMFRVFSAKTRSIGRGTSCAKRLSLLKRLAFSALVPALVVTAVAVGVSIASDGRDIGYGKRSCYLDSALLVGVATVLPLGVFTVCNVAFFAVAVFKIYSVKKLQTTDGVKKENTKNLYVYIRLSTLTGICWIFAILAEAINNDPMRFIYIILNGLQGVFIFLSYICNRRVLNLYTGKEKDKKSTSFASSTTNTNTNRQRRNGNISSSTTFSSVISSPD